MFRDEFLTPLINQEEETWEVPEMPEEEFGGEEKEKKGAEEEGTEEKEW